MGPSPHMWFSYSKQGIMDNNYESLWVQDLTCRFVHAKQRDLQQNDKSIWVPAMTCRFVHVQESAQHPNY